ncbi:sphingomyelin phosphodiesterase 5-like [Poecile atricapillus]|uniref:sphingomyelin phosphodiesterase 5-like n=1 Tax=Poecile atricapillus TaxID=48891 RepID=UPI002738E2A7|nr:sphingomyelin phosphodiesterase 5-like [Poecile atricapillus]
MPWPPPSTLPDTPFPNLAVAVVAAVAEALLAPGYWSLDHLLSLQPTTAQRASWRRHRAGHCLAVATRLVVAPVLVLLVLLALPPALLGLALWLPAQAKRRSFVQQRAAGAATPRPWDARTSRGFTFLSANVCLLPDGLARFSNLGHGRRRAAVIGRALGGGQRPAAGEDEEGSGCRRGLLEMGRGKGGGYGGMEDRGGRTGVDARTAGGQSEVGGRAGVWPEVVVDSTMVDSTVVDNTVMDNPTMMDNTVMDNTVMDNPTMMDNPMMTNPTPMTNPTMTNPTLMTNPMMMANPTMTNPTPMTNPTMTNPTMTNPMMTHPMMTNPVMMANPTMNNPMMTHPMMTNPMMMTNPTMTNPTPMTNPTINNPMMTNPTPMTNPMMTHPMMTNPVMMTNPTMTTPTMTNPTMTNPTPMTNPRPIADPALTPAPSPSPRPERPIPLPDPMPPVLTARVPPDTDFLCLQEVFDAAAAAALRRQLGRHFPYVLWGVGPGGLRCGRLRVLGSGLLLASRFPLTAARFHPFPVAAREDALANKGLLVAQVLLGTRQGRRVVGYLGCTHLQAPAPDATIRDQQLSLSLRWLRDFRGDQEQPGDLVAFDVLCGDLNFDNCSRGDAQNQQHPLFQEFWDPARRRPGQDQPWAIGTLLDCLKIYEQPVSNPEEMERTLSEPWGRGQFLAGPILSSGALDPMAERPWQGRRVDVVLLRRNPELTTEVTGLSVITQLATLSDHLPVALRLRVGPADL